MIKRSVKELGEAILQLTAEQVEADRTEAFQRIQLQFQQSLQAMAPTIVAQFNSLADMAEGWFSGMQGFGEPNFHGDAMLVVTELAEAVEADRTNATSDKVPAFHGREEELADALVRLLHMTGKYNIRLGDAFIAKMQYNLNRPFKHGKEY